MRSRVVALGMASDDAVLGVYLSFPDRAAAEAVGRVLVERRLAACVNILPAGRSIYRWQGRTVAEDEVVAWAKTTSGRLRELTETVQAMHPYELPCVVAYAAEGGSAAYLDWVRAEVDEEER